MTTIQFIDGKPILRDGKVSTNDECCVCPACCQHYCNKMCCNQIKWTVPGYTDSYTTVGQADCRTTLTLPGSGVQIRLRVRCSGYVFKGSGYQDCDTDCEIVGVEYSEDGGTTWTTTPPSAAEGVTWSIYCSGDAAQPESQHSGQRCAVFTSTNEESCENDLDGEFCNLFTQEQIPCPPCVFACPPPPTEWRIVDGLGRVWFAGDIIDNPAYEGDVLCTDPCVDSLLTFTHPRLLMDNFPWPAKWSFSSCGRLNPAGWLATNTNPDSWSLNVQVLGCDGSNWQNLVKEQCKCFTGAADTGSFPDTSDPCLIDGYFVTNPPHQVDDVADLSGNVCCSLYQSPPGCSCLRDQAGNIVGNTDEYGLLCCSQCNYHIGATGCGSGLEYLGHTQGVRFTGAVDTEGSNVWNWEDSEGRSPAGWLPTEDGFAGALVGDRSIVIAGELRSWREGAGRGLNPSAIQFASVSLEPGAVLAISLTTETLTVDDAKIEELTLVSGVPKYCANGGQYAVGITVTGTATFKNGAENNAIGELSNPYSPYAGITGHCVFESGSKNLGTIAGNCDFSDDASNEGTITGNCTFTGDAVNNGTITGDATFSGNAVNAGTVTGNCTFSGSATNNGTVDGDATFSGTASMAGNVTGTATFTGSACHTSGTAGTFVPDPPPAC